MSQSLQAEIIALIENYVSYSSGMNFAAKKALWDTDNQQVLLKPEEIEAPLIGWDAIDGYWSASKGVMKSLKAKSRQHRVKQITDDLVECTFHTIWVAEVNGPSFPKPVAGDVRVAALLRRKPEGWRLIHYVEAPIGLYPHVRKAYEQTFTEHFPEGFVS